MKNNVKNSRIFGIDLGTSYTVISYLDDTGKAQVIPNKDGDLKTPSIVYVGEGCQEILVGTAARNMAMLEPERTFKEFKRDIESNPTYMIENGEIICPQWCITKLLKYMRGSAVKHFDDPLAASQAVITVPAYFKEKERQGVMQSASQAGIEVIQLINEPTAAGLAYGLCEKQGDRLVLIADFGGGTFDVSLLQYAGGRVDVVASHGDKQLGGKDVDDRLLELVRDRFSSEHNLEISQESHPADWFNITEEILRQKHMLASRKEVKIIARVDGKQVQILVTRELLKIMMQPLIDRIESVTLECIENAKVDIGDIQHVLLVGGSSRLMPFQDLLKGLFGESSLISGQISPDMAVAEGAAIQAARRVVESGDTLVDQEGIYAIPTPNIEHTDVMAHSLGIAILGFDISERICSVILERNMTIPCQSSRSYSSITDHQKRFLIQVLQGEDGQSVEDCLIVGEEKLELPARDSSKKSLDISMQYDLSGMVHIIVHDLITDKTHDITVNFSVAA